jgi:hypothetical protein
MEMEPGWLQLRMGAKRHVTDETDTMHGSERKDSLTVLLKIAASGEDGWVAETALASKSERGRRRPTRLNEPPNRGFWEGQEPVTEDDDSDEFVVGPQQAQSS